MTQFQQLRIIELPEEEPPRTLEQEIRAALYGACVYHQPAVIKIGHREGVLLSRDRYEILSAQAKAYLDGQDD